MLGSRLSICNGRIFCFLFLFLKREFFVSVVKTGNAFLSTTLKILYYRLLGCTFRNIFQLFRFYAFVLQSLLWLFTEMVMMLAPKFCAVE